MNTERDRYLYEALGECLHELDKDYKNPWYEFPKCKICGKQTPHIGRQVSLSSWEGFGKLWEWCNRPGNMNWVVFIAYCQQIIDGIYSEQLTNFPISTINPDRFADALYKYLKEK